MKGDAVCSKFSGPLWWNFRNLPAHLQRDAHHQICLHIRRLCHPQTPYHSTSRYVDIYGANLFSVKSLALFLWWQTFLQDSHRQSPRFRGITERFASFGFQVHLRCVCMRTSGWHPKLFNCNLKRVGPGVVCMFCASNNRLPVPETCKIVFSETSSIWSGATRLQLSTLPSANLLNVTRLSVTTHRINFLLSF